jgi:hypothetical protein
MTGSPLTRILLMRVIMDFLPMTRMIVGVRIMSRVFVVVIADRDMVVLSFPFRMVMYNLDLARVGGFHRQGI